MFSAYKWVIAYLIAVFTCVLSSKPLYDIDGALLSANDYTSCDLNSIIHVHGNNGIISSFPDTTCTFHVYNIPSGSYLLEVINTTYVYEPVRVEINTKGKVRARRVDFVQTSQINSIAYPLRLRPLGQYRYFQPRDKIRIFDFLMNPMVLMMVLPVLLIMMLPKLANDPETKKEMSQLNTNFEMPDVSDFMTSLFKPAAIESSTSGARTSGRNSKKKN